MNETATMTAAQQISELIGNRPWREATYGPYYKPIRQAIIGIITGEQVRGSDKRVQWSNFVPLLATGVGVTTWTCISERDAKINAAIRNEPLPAKKLTPEEQYPGCVLFWRIGDFYETFGDDAVKLHRTVGVAMTKGKGRADTEIAGVPYHAIERVLQQMILAGHKPIVVPTNA